ncbi:MAG TPA: T9SS type A sorting domain-containing protein, partial [Ignavibacteriaceae bacterium]|nr:T9SS type A sorting domain-containing protein [Ignavibacteriaceae bacterium]
SLFGSDGVKYDQTSAGWTGEAAPGIYGCRFTPNAHKLFADPPKGWICYVDELNGVAFAKTFPVFEGAVYPDDGARVAVYMDARYVEIEVTGPVEDIPAGGMISFIEDWYAGKVNGPILNVNPAGAVNSFLKLNDNIINGNYGVFHVGKAKVIFLDTSNQVIGEGQEHAVSPLENFALSETVSIPENTEWVELRVYDNNGNFVDVLDKNSLDNLTAVEENNIANPKEFMLYQNYPNPFNPETMIRYSLPVRNHVELKIFDMLGRETETLLNEEQDAGNYEIKLSAKHLSSGIYFYTIKTEDFTSTKKLILMK